MITQAELVQNVFQFLRKDLLVELKLQITSRQYDEPNFDEIFEAHKFSLIEKINDFVERQEGAKVEVPVHRLGFPTG
jgi:hypothetical protein